VTDHAVSVRCSTWARETGVLPGGTAPRSDVFVLVEHPLPWPSDVASDPTLAELQRVASASAGPDRVVRLQAVAGEPAAATRRVVVFAADTSPFTAYGRAEGAGAPDELPTVVSSLVRAAPTAAPASPVTDLLVCTHGSRDSCCGSLGTRLWLDLADGLDGVRVWRTSHTGGHRFAPTAITFPDGNYWAHLDRDVVEGIVSRRLPADVALRHLRGCAAFSPAVQVAEGAVLAERGWAWLDAARFGDERSDRRVELCFEAADGERGSYDVVLDEGRSVPVPDCGGDPSAAAKFQRELRVAGLRAWS